MPQEISMDKPSADSPAPPFPTFAGPELRNNSNVVREALYRKLLTPADLDATCQAHVDGLAGALQRDPTLPLPDGMAPAFSTDDLWRLCAIPSLVEELAKSIREKGLTLTKWDINSHSTPRPVPPIIEAAILDQVRAKAIPEETLQHMRSRGWFSDSGAATLLTLRRSAGAKRAAAIRKATKASGAAASIFHQQRPPAY